MKEEWKVYIKGVPERGKEVIKALEDCGASNSGGYIGDDTLIYFIRHDGIIDFVCDDTEYGKIIMDNYTELQLPEKWKDGDVLFNRTNKSFSVYRKEKDNKSFISHIYISYDDFLFVNGWCWDKDYSLATDEEIGQFHELLHKQGKEWDAEKKQLVDWRWKPKIYETYWSITGSKVIIRSIWMGTHLDNKYFEIGNCFQSREEAEAAAERVKKALKGGA